MRSRRRFAASSRAGWLEGHVDHAWVRNAETFRRLFVPYYEEARLYFDAAKADGIFGDVNEVWPYLDSTLQRNIADYGNE